MEIDKTPPKCTIGYLLLSFLMAGIFWILRLEGSQKALAGITVNSFALGVAVGLMGLHRDSKGKVRYSHLSGFAAIASPYLLAMFGAEALGTLNIQTGRDDGETIRTRTVLAEEYLNTQQNILQTGTFLVVLGAASVYLWLRWKRSKSTDSDIPAMETSLDGWGLAILVLIFSRALFSF